jgi:hypothetical protein
MDFFKSSFTSLLIFRCVALLYCYNSAQQSTALPNSDLEVQVSDPDILTVVTDTTGDKENYQSWQIKKRL